jgi:hypothetical protein
MEGAALIHLAFHIHGSAIMDSTNDRSKIFGKKIASALNKF